MLQAHVCIFYFIFAMEFQASIRGTALQRIYFLYARPMHAKLYAIATQILPHTQK